MINKFIYPPILVGLITGLIISIISIFILYPIIHEAELIESALNTQIDHHIDTSEHLNAHSHEDAKNDDTLNYFQNRNFITVFVNICVTAGYAFIIIGLTNLLKININFKNSILIGLVGFLCFYLLPSIALIPQLPGTEYSLTLEYRQIIWLSIVSLSLIGFVITYIIPKIFFKFFGILLVVLPLTSILILNDQIPMEVNNDLHYKFIYYTFLSNLIMWFIMAVTINYVLNRKSS
jgi:cobalt transporter subunit CbtA